MKKEKIVSALFTLLLFFSAGVAAQQSVNATGGEATGNGSASYSIGQMVFSQNQGTDQFEIQGVQQPYEITVVSISDEIENGSLELAIFPNPTSDLLHLQVAGFETEDLSYQLISIEGKQIRLEKIMGDLSTISMSDLPSAAYYLTVTNSQKTIKTFKIIKN